MPERLLTTRLTIPAPRPDWVRRPRLHARLDAGLAGKLTLVSAPAGFGKTSCVSDWLHSRDLPAAWLSLEAADGDPAHMLRYLAAALHQISLPGTVDVDADLEAGADPQTVLIDLINALAVHDQPQVLVLDDYHLIDAPAIDALIERLLSYQPPQLQLVLLTRADPALPLARLRAQAALCELRAADLRFTADEAAAFLRDAQGRPYPPTISAALTEKTEGWIAGLQLAALALRQAADPAAFVNAFCGSHRYIIDYLTDEVLAQQPENVRHFLLHTAILEQLSAPLCEAVLDQDGAQTMLEQLEAANLFLQPLDGERRWYRYHQLFAEVLRRRLQQHAPDAWAGLHRRAGQWYAAHNLAAPAVRHALASGDQAFAAQTVEAQAAPALKRGDAAIVGRWLDALDPVLVERSPRLCLQRAWVAYFANDVEHIEPWLAQAEQHTPEREQLRGDSAALRAWVAFRQGAFQQAAQGFQQALAVLPETASFQRGINLMFLGDAQQQLGDTRQAVASYQAALPWCRAAGNSAALLGATLKLATAYRAQGALQQARTLLQQAYDTLPPQAPQSVVYLHLGLAEVCYEQNELDTAAAHMQAGLDLVQRRRTLIHVLPLLLLARARLAQAGGDAAAARAALAQAGEHQQVLTDARVAALFALRQVHLWLLQGDLTAAQAWNAALAIDAQQLFSSEVLLICRARILLALGRSRNDAALLREAQALLADLEPQARAAGRHGHELLIALLQTQTAAAMEQREPARAALAKALHLAEAEGFVRIIVDEGPPMAALLAEAVARRIVPDYAGRLLAAFPAPAEHAPGDQSQSAGLIEPLTERERDVLRLLAAGQPNRAIADTLVLSVGTVKVHTRNIYGKLGVRNRTQAVSRARDLGLV